LGIRNDGDRSDGLLPLKGDPLTFEEIYRAHFEFVWRTLRRLGVSESDAQDVCQKVFLVAFRRIAEFEARSSVRTWLCGIALRVVSDYRRSAASRREISVGELPSDVTTDAGQLQQVEQLERLAELDAILVQLPLEQRTVLVLFELEEMSGQAIAQLVGVPVGTVRSRLRLARQAFSRILAERRTILRFAAGGEP
jgi:RNA polymerase sigma-70 factor, ECF subfamily